MNLLERIKAKIAEVKALVDADKLDEAKVAKEELIALQAKYDLLADMGEYPEGEPVIDNNPFGEPAAAADAVHLFAEAARAGFSNAYTGGSEGVKEDGGYTVPEDIKTKINMYKEDKFSLKSLVSVEKVSTLSGRRTFQKKKQHTGFAKVTEAGKIAAKETPKFEVLSYKVEKYAGYLPVTNELLSDSDANITNTMVEWLGDEGLATENTLILTAIKTKPAVELKDMDGIKKAVNVTLGQAYAAGVSIITNDDGLNFLDTLKDKDGRYLLSWDAQDPMKMVLAVGARKIPVVVVPNSVLATAGKAMPFIVGDLKEGIRFFDREQLTIATSNTAAVGDLNAFEQDLTIFRGIERLDVKVQDLDAFVNGTITTA